jgi:hypothetical protein
VLGSALSDATLNLHLPMHPNDGFIEMVSALCPLPQVFCTSSPSPNSALGGSQGSHCVIHDFNPPLPEDAARTERNWAHAGKVKQRKDERKQKRTDRTRRKAERENHRRMQREAREEEEESSEEEDDKDDEDEGVHPYDWLDSLSEEEEQPEGLSLSIEGRTSHIVSRRTPT